MSEPLFIINKQLRTECGYLATSALQQTRDILLAGGFVLLPSDTCYSLGALAINENVRTNVNAVLSRRNEPISLAFSSYLNLQLFVDVNETIAIIVERFTPGPITIVCRAKDTIPDVFLERTLGSRDRTIGVRIPDSLVERDVAGSTIYQLMTVAVRHQGQEIRDFEAAVDVVKAGIEKLSRDVRWGAIEGERFYDSHSTVVSVPKLNYVKRLRDGYIPFSAVKEEVKRQQRG